MLIPESTLKLVTIAYASVALFGAVLVLCTAFTARKGIDGTILRAKAFLSESFLKDNGMLLLIVCNLFLIHTAIELIPIYRLSVEESVAEFVKELTELGISVCIAILAYKWLSLINPSRHLEANGKQESYSIKKVTEKALKILQDEFATRE
jgi:hypothetical protein